MSQFLDCFSSEQIERILKMVVARLEGEDRVFILEPLLGSQPYQVGNECLAAFSLYFTAIANGTSRFYRKDEFLRFIEDAGLKLEKSVDDLGTGHSLLICRKA